MRTTAAWLSPVVLTLGLAFAGGNLAQTRAVDALDFELIAVDGNTLVVKDQNGTREVTVPSDFRFTVDGKSVSVADLKPGMKGTATVTTTTTVRPVVVTEVREAQVLRASDLSVTVREADGSTRRYSQGELDKKSVEIVRDGRPIRLADLRRGDKLTATVITSGPPSVLTEKEVEATLAEAEPQPAATQVATAAAVQPAADARPAALQPAAAVVEPQPAESSGMGMMGYVLMGIVILMAIVLAMRSRKQS